jgi:hypothetical protein
LSNNPGWTEHYYARSFYNVVINQVPDAEGNILWSNIDRYPLFHDASEYFDVDNGTVVVLTADDITERFFFGSTRENTEVNYIYLHKIDLLKRFILYFKEKAKPIIDESEKTKIIIPKRDYDDGDSKFYSDELIRGFLDKIKINKVTIRANGKDYFISKNDAKILSLMKCGYTAKEISNDIGLKQKTVEMYRDKLKFRLDTLSKSKLIYTAKNNSLIDIGLLKSN